MMSSPVPSGVPSTSPAGTHSLTAVDPAYTAAAGAARLSLLIARAQERWYASVAAAAAHAVVLGDVISRAGAGAMSLSTRARQRAAKELELELECARVSHDQLVMAAAACEAAAEAGDAESFSSASNRPRACGRRRQRPQFVWICVSGCGNGGGRCCV